MEVIPGNAKDAGKAECILHVCGGDPNIHAIAYEEMMVFSTYVEVLLYWDSWRNHECNYTRPQGKILKSQASKKQKEIFR